MTQWLYFDFAVFLVVIAMTGIIIPKILLIAFRRQLFDSSNDRKVHKGAVPRLGGIAFFPSILFALLGVFGVSVLYGDLSVNTNDLYWMVCFALITCAIITLYLVGMADDLIGVKYRAKFMAQIFASVLVIGSGVEINSLHGFMGLYVLPHGVSMVLTCLLIVFITNAINLIDGIDGLASGLSALACGSYGALCLVAGEYVFSAIAFATLGALIPFFYFNVFGHADRKNKIFMGDTGALTIGMVLSVLSIKICSLEVVTGDSNPAMLAFSPLLIPCFDVVRVYLYRLNRRKNPFMPDKTHIHHKLLALGMSQRVALPVIVASSLVLSMLNFMLCDLLTITFMFFVDIAIWSGANLVLTRLIRKREERLSVSLYE